MKQFGDKDAKLVLSNIINRVRFMYRWQEIASYVFRCLCVRRAKEKKEHHFNKGKDKLLQELDVITLLKSMRKTKLLTQALLNQRQKMLLNF